MPNVLEEIAVLAEALGIEGGIVALAATGRTETICFGTEGQRRVDAGTLFQAASTGKHLTACAVIELAQSGQIELGLPLGHYLPDAPPAWADRSILSLLLHTSGIPEYLAPIDGGDVPTTRAAFMQRYRDLVPLAAEGAVWGYSNTNYILLGFLIAALSGQSYAAYIESMLVRERVDGAQVASPDWVRAQNLAATGQRGKDWASREREVTGDGDIAFTVDGALGWLTALLSRPQGDPLFAPAALGNGRLSPYACGWFVEHLASEPIAHHAGHFGGYTAMAFLNRGMHAGVLALCNHAPGNTRAIRALAQAALEDFAPGATPLGLRPVADNNSDLTEIARKQLIRSDGTIDREAFAPELRAAIDKGGPARGVVNLWTGVEPQSFDLVEEYRQGRDLFRRYRLRYADRIEHCLVGTGADGTIFWAWPL
jgi:D-alanyl-D-alanine carboxypeptidase